MYLGRNVQREFTTIMQKKTMKAHEINITSDNPDEKPGKTVAKAALKCGIGSALLVTEYTSGIYGDTVEVGDWMHVLAETIKEAQSGKTENTEAVLTAQALALDAIFTSMAKKANLNNRMDQIELCMRLALKAQNQSRATLQTLAQIKNPQKAVFMRQANIAHGPQQVNNATSEKHKEEKDSSRKKIKTEQNKLLGADEKGDRLDFGTKGKTGRDDQEMEALGAIDGAKNSKRKGKSGSKCL